MKLIEFDWLKLKIVDILFDIGFHQEFKRGPAYTIIDYKYIKLSKEENWSV